MPTTQAASGRRPVLLPADVLARDRGLLVLGTLAVWAHTADEIRIGEYVAVPAALATAALLLGWSRARPFWRGLGALLLGLLWLLGAIPYHVLPLLQGAVVWQNVSGLLQLAGGAALLLPGLRELRRRHLSADVQDG